MKPRWTRARRRPRVDRLGSALGLFLVCALAGCASDRVVYRPAVVWNLSETSQLPQAKHVIPRETQAVSLLVTGTGLMRGGTLGLEIPTVHLHLVIANQSEAQGFVLFCQESSLEVEGIGEVKGPFAISEGRQVKTLAVPPSVEVELDLYFELPDARRPESVPAFTFRGPSRYDGQEYLIFSRFLNE